MDSRRDFAPAIESLEHAAEVLSRQAEKLLELAREEQRRLQDYDAELEAGAAGEFAGSVQVSRHNAAHRLRWIDRALFRASAGLVPPGSPNYVAAQKSIGYVDEAQSADAPWRALELVAGADEAA